MAGFPWWRDVAAGQQQWGSAGRSAAVGVSWPAWARGPAALNLPPPSILRRRRSVNTEDIGEGEGEAREGKCSGPQAAIGGKLRNTQAIHAGRGRRQGGEANRSSPRSVPSTPCS